MSDAGGAETKQRVQVRGVCVDIMMHEHYILMYETHND